jgi:hypothetical protein
MQVFRNLFLRGEPDRLAAVAESIRQAVNGDWTRDTDAEAHMRSFAANVHDESYCFKCSKRGRRPAATVFLMHKDPDTLYVTNIVPHDQHELSYSEYNDILEEFFNQFVDPVAKQAGVQAELTAPEADLETWLSPEVAKKLRMFSRLANKYSGSSHPMDRGRWYDFIVSAHQEGADFDASTLARWLQEVGGWDERLSHELAIEYEFARGLLSFADGQRVGA